MKTPLKYLNNKNKILSLIIYNSSNLFLNKEKKCKYCNQEMSSIDILNHL